MGSKAAALIERNQTFSESAAGDTSSGNLQYRSHMKRGVLANALWGTLDRYMRLFLGIISTAIIARYLGPQFFGILGIAISYTALIAGMANLGLDAMAVRWMTDATRERGATLSAIVCIRFASAIFWFSLLVVYLYTVSPLSPDVRMATILLSAVVFFNALEALEIVFFTEGRTQIVACARTSMVVVGFAIKMTVVYLGLDMHWLIAAMFFEAVLSVEAVLFVYRRYFGSRLKLSRPDFSMTLNLVGSAGPFLISNTVVILNLQAGKILLYNTLGAQEFGIYYAAIRLVEVLYIIPVAFGNAFFSRLASGPGTGPRDAGQYNLPYTLMSCIASVAIVGGLIFGKPFLLLLYGSKFSETYGVFCILVFSTLFIFHVSIRTKQLINEDAQGLILVLSVLTLLVNVLATFGLSTVWGLKGAALAFVMTWLCNALVFPAIMGRRDLVVAFFASFHPDRVKSLRLLRSKG
jgi:PST family polysaccharide transporter